MCMDATLKLCLYWVLYTNCARLFRNYWKKNSVRSPFNNHTYISCCNQSFKLCKRNIRLVYYKHGLSPPGYKANSPWRTVCEPALFKIHPFLNCLTVPNWLAVKFHYFLIGSKLEILDTLPPLAATYLTLLPVSQFMRIPISFLLVLKWIRL